MGIVNTNSDQYPMRIMRLTNFTDFGLGNPPLREPLAPKQIDGFSSNMLTACGNKF